MVARTLASTRNFQCYVAEGWTAFAFGLGYDTFSAFMATVALRSPSKGPSSSYEFPRGPVAAHAFLVSLNLTSDRDFKIPQVSEILLLRQNKNKNIPSYRFVKLHFDRLTRGRLDIGAR